MLSRKFLSLASFFILLFCVPTLLVHANPNYSWFGTTFVAEGSADLHGVGHLYDSSNQQHMVYSIGDVLYYDDSIYGWASGIKLYTSTEGDIKNVDIVTDGSSYYIVFNTETSYKNFNVYFGASSNPEVFNVTFTKIINGTDTNLDPEDLKLTRTSGTTWLGFTDYDEIAGYTKAYVMNKPDSGSWSSETAFASLGHVHKFGDIYYSSSRQKFYAFINDNSYGATPLEQGYVFQSSNGISWVLNGTFGTVEAGQYGIQNEASITEDGGTLYLAYTQSNDGADNFILAKEDTANGGWLGFETIMTEGNTLSPLSLEVIGGTVFLWAGAYGTSFYYLKMYQGVGSFTEFSSEFSILALGLIIIGVTAILIRRDKHKQ